MFTLREKNLNRIVYIETMRDQSFSVCAHNSTPIVIHRNSVIFLSRTLYSPYTFDQTLRTIVSISFKKYPTVDKKLIEFM